MHTPKEIVALTGISSYFAGLPILNVKGLRDCQYEAITELEKSFRQGQQRALIVLATGAGKTFTACLSAYRLLSYTPARRILFLVDRNNLGKQAEGEFGTFKLTETGDPFNAIFATERLKSKNIPKESNLVISTIQRLFALLSGQEIQDTDDDESSDDEGAATIDLPSDLYLPRDFFDAIVIDECHRSIYGRWRKVLDYFSTAKFIGLTATPDPTTTLPFFNNNCVINYTLEKSIADGINVDGRVYRIKTEATESGGIIKKDSTFIEKTRHTGKVQIQISDTDEIYKSTQLDRSVVNPEQIKLILQSYKDAVFKDLYPDRRGDFASLPKTLIFAKSDAHASNIIEIIKDVFPNQCEDFAQKITYSAGNSDELIRKFRNEKTFRIAVTVTLVATGTDVKPLEVLLFMRDINSESLYVQMKGRGVRTISDEALKNVTPNATSKDLFYLVDAVGVTEHEKLITPTGENKAIISLAELLEKISHGYLPDEYLRLLASRLSRINKKAQKEQLVKFEGFAKISIKDIVLNIFKAFEDGFLPEFADVNSPNLERKKLVENLSNNPLARAYLLEINAGFIKTLSPGDDKIIFTGFSTEDAKSTTAAFEKYVNEHRDEIEALRIIYNNTGEPITYALLTDLADKLCHENFKFKIATLWNSYAIFISQSCIKV